MSQKELVPKRRFEGFVDNWQLKKWKDTVDISTNMVDPKTRKYDDLIHLSPGNIESFTGRILDNIKKVKQENLISGKFHFNPGDIIYGKINPQLGKYVLSKFEGLSSADAYVLNAKNGISQNFLYTVLQSSDFYKYSVSVSSRTGMPKINRNELNQYNFLAPSLEEQQKIGQFFKHLDEMIALQQEKIDKTKALKSAYLAEMFPAEGERIPKRRFEGFTDEWKKQPLNMVADYRNGKAHEQSVVNHGNYIIVNSKFVSTNGYTKKYSNRQIEPLIKGEIAFVLSDVPSGRAIARTYLIQTNNKFTLNQRIAGITPKENTDSYFLKELMNRHKYFLNFDDGVNQTNISNDDLESFEAYYPDFKEQQKIGEFFKHLDDIITTHEQKLEKLKATKQAYLHEMFV